MINRLCDCRLRLSRSFSVAAIFGYVTYILLVAAARSTDAAEPWIDTRQLGPFICHGTFPLDHYETLFAEFPQLQRELLRTLGLPPAQQPINIYLFRDEAEHRAFLNQRYSHVPYRRALFIKEGGEAGIYAYRHAELDIDLRHECTHALLHAVLSNVPLWLDEGLAEYFEVPPAHRAFDHPHLDSLRWNMRLGMVQSLESLEQRQELPEMDGFDYRYSWAWVHFMLHGPKTAHQALVAYIASLRKISVRAGAPPSIAETASSANAIQLATYLDSAKAAASAAPLSSQLSRALPNTTDRMVHHFKHWHK